VDAGGRAATGRFGRALADESGAPAASPGRLAPQRQVTMYGGTRRPQSHVQAVLATIGRYHRARPIRAPAA